MVPSGPGTVTSSRRPAYSPSSGRDGGCPPSNSARSARRDSVHETRGARSRSAITRSSAPSFTGSRSLHVEQLDVEKYRGVGRDRARIAALTVAELGRNRELALATHLHAHDAVLHPADHRAGPDLEHHGRLA